MFMDNHWDTTRRRDQPAQPQVYVKGTYPGIRPGQTRLAQALVDKGPAVLPDAPHRHPYGAAQVRRPLPSPPPLFLPLSLLIPCRGRHGLVVVGAAASDTHSGYSHALAESVLSRLHPSGCPILLYAQVYSP